MTFKQICLYYIFVRRANTKPTKEWLSILEKEDVPVLICLTFAEKLFAELMGENGDNDLEKVKLGIQTQLDVSMERKFHFLHATTYCNFTEYLNIQTSNLIT